MRGAASVALLSALTFAVGAVSCKSDEEPFVIKLVAPLGESAFGGTPSVARVELRVRNVDGVERALGNVAVSDGQFEVADAIKSGIGSVVLAGIGADGAVLAYGRTPSLELEGLSGRATIAISIFVQRTPSIAPALKLGAKPVSPRCASIGTRFGLIADAEGAHADVIDLLDWTVAREEAFETAPVSLATAGSLVLAIDRDGKATLIDLAKGTRTTPSAPEGASFADVAFGTTIRDESGGAWIVGPTRSTSPSDVALRLGDDGAIVARKLQRARRSAAAAWVAGRGLVIAYGDDTIGVELLAPGTTTSSLLPFPVDARAGGALIALDGNRILRVDPEGVATTLDLACAKDCVPVATTLKDEPRVARADDHATPLEGGGAVIVRGGRVLRLSRDGGKLELLHDAGASAVCSALLPNGSVALAIAGDDIVRTIAPSR